MQNIIVYGRKNCPWCDKAVALLKERNYVFSYHDIEEDPQTRLDFNNRTKGAKTVPQILVGEHLVGGFDRLSLFTTTGIFQQLVGGQ